MNPLSFLSKPFKWASNKLSDLFDFLINILLIVAMTGIVALLLAVTFHLVWNSIASPQNRLEFKLRGPYFLAFFAISKAIILNIIYEETIQNIALIFFGVLLMCFALMMTPLGSMLPISFLIPKIEMDDLLDNWLLIVIFLVGLSLIGLFLYLKYKKCKKRNGLKEETDGKEICGLIKLNLIPIFTAIVGLFFYMSMLIDVETIKKWLFLNWVQIYTYVIIGLFAVVYLIQYKVIERIKNWLFSASASNAVEKKTNVVENKPNGKPDVAPSKTNGKTNGKTNVAQTKTKK